MGSFCLGVHPPIWLKGSPTWFNDPNERFAFDPNFDEFGDFTHRAIPNSQYLDDSSQPLTPFQPSGPINILSGPTNMLLTMTPLTMKNSGLILVGSMLILSRKPWNSLPSRSLHSQYFCYEEAPQVLISST